MLAFQSPRGRNYVFRKHFSLNSSRQIIVFMWVDERKTCCRSRKCTWIYKCTWIISIDHNGRCATSTDPRQLCPENMEHRAFPYWQFGVEVTIVFILNVMTLDLECVQLWEMTKLSNVSDDQLPSPLFLGAPGLERPLLGKYFGKGMRVDHSVSL